MYVDAQNRPSLSQSLIGAAGTTVSTDSIDLLAANDNPGRAMPLRAFASLTIALAGGTSVQAQLICSASSNLSSPTVLASGPVVAEANGTLGAVLMDVPLPDVPLRYLGFQYVTLGTHTAGAVSAEIVGGTTLRSTDTVVMNTGL